MVHMPSLEGMGLKDLLWCTNSHNPCGPSAIHTTNKHRAANLAHSLRGENGKMHYTTNNRKLSQQCYVSSTIVWPQ